MSNEDKDVLRRLTQLVWIKLGKARNPLLNQVMSCSSADDVVVARFTAWNTTRLELGRALFHVVFRDVSPDLGLIKKALDFLDS